MAAGVFAQGGASVFVAGDAPALQDRDHVVDEDIDLVWQEMGIRELGSVAPAELVAGGLFQLGAQGLGFGVGGGQKEGQARQDFGSRTAMGTAVISPRLRGGRSYAGTGWG
ncbi:hypothetical protein AB0P05_43235 [Streptomyces flaveolus]|uniref:hypothetical protein n=1 Tax=Streptomyces flaveolus TaxID=67297 RepID=UPI003417ED22